MDVIMPSTIGLVVRSGRSILAGNGFAGFTVQPKLPSTLTKRMATVRDDSGPDDGVQTRRRKGVNLWAEDPVVAENACLVLMAGFRKLPDGKPVTATDEFTGPYEVIDEVDDLITVDGVKLSHYFFSFRISARGSDF